MEVMYCIVPQQLARGAVYYLVQKNKLIVSLKYVTTDCVLPLSTVEINLFYGVTILLHNRHQ